MTDVPPRGIVVIDVGSTNTKLLLFDHDLTVHAEESVPSAKQAGPPYEAIDPDPILALAAAALPRLDAILPVDVVVPCTHGSALALLDADGALALPIMDYNARPPEDVVTAYAAIAPSFAEVLAPINPGGLTLGRQLLWQEQHWPDAFAKVETILPFAQYLALQLGGQAVTERTSLGAQSQLWAMQEDRPSSLADARDWARRFPPLALASDPVGQLSDRFGGAGLRGRGEIRAGIHDSSANYLRYQGAVSGRFALLSTGTWIIGFDAGADPSKLDPAYDTACGLTIHGATVPICRFLGGGEYALIGGETAAAPSEAVLTTLVEAGIMALPNFTDSGGPLPACGGTGYLTGQVDTAEARASLAALYCAQMTATALERLSGGDPAPTVIVDGPFGQNPIYLGALAALLPDAEVTSSTLREGTAAGAALLALAGSGGAVPALPVPLNPAAPLALPGLPAYHASWREKVGLPSP